MGFGDYVIGSGESVEVTDASAIDWYKRHGCTTTEPIENVPVVKPFRRKKRISRKD